MEFRLLLCLPQLLISRLRTQVLTGEAGLDRRVSWAHVCELPDPTEYLADGELLMAVGYIVPEGSSEQKAYVERLADAGLSGLLIAEKMHAPDLSCEMTSAADRRSFSHPCHRLQRPVHRHNSYGPRPTGAQNTLGSYKPFVSTRQHAWP